ncbi:hypothetical protein PRZ48_013867 [Zasmidium cellare]|uniref:Acetyl-CoA synthetase-like protein n=1 Tax=Zasmidium cellare TaxID=395010 RepID=A0ABR0E2M4_ZASCE|nr:hypothetical protein PRZ48_013867 [Zasmidium cellare]
MAAILQGSTTTPPSQTTIGPLLRQLVSHHGPKPALRVPWQNRTSTYTALDLASQTVARALINSGAAAGDHIGILAGNRHEYLEIFLGAARIGCAVVCLSCAYTVAEAENALRGSVFVAGTIGNRDMGPAIEHVERLIHDKESELKEVVVIGDESAQQTTYAQFLERASSSPISDTELRLLEDAVESTSPVLLQFTSGTTGNPKVSVLTSSGILNNGQYVGDRMQLTPNDTIVCPPPLFHTFGIVVGFLASMTHGSSFVLPSDIFNAEAAVKATISCHGTALLGVPTMFLAELEWMKKHDQWPSTLRTGIIGGSIVSQSIMKRIKTEMGLGWMLIAYGTTETSPISFLCSSKDNAEQRHGSVGRVLPNTAAKVVDPSGKTMQVGERGEICVSGHGLQKCYYRNPAKTEETMRKDEDGVEWFRTGDEGGENIYPAEIEEGLVSHSGVSEACVVGVKDEYYGEVVVAFLKGFANVPRPSDQELALLIKTRLARHKVPRHILWVGDADVVEDYPKTSSGKHQKHVLSTIAQGVIAARA